MSEDQLEDHAMSQQNCMEELVMPRSHTLCGLVCIVIWQTFQEWNAWAEEEGFSMYSQENLLESIYCTSDND